MVRGASPIPCSSPPLCRAGAPTHPEAHSRRHRHRRDQPRFHHCRRRRDEMEPLAGARGRNLRRHHRRRHFRGRDGGVQERSKPGDTILAMLPDAGERYLSTPLFGDIGFDTNEEELKIFQLDAEPPHSAKGGLAGQQGRSGLERGRSHCWLARACHHGTPRRHLRKCRVALTGAIVGVFWRLNQNILCRISGTICHCRLDHLYLCLALAPGLATLRTPP